jgi:hypothetical protein
MAFWGQIVSTLMNPAAEKLSESGKKAGERKEMAGDARIKAVETKDAAAENTRDTAAAAARKTDRDTIVFSFFFVQRRDMRGDEKTEPYDVE